VDVLEAVAAVGNLKVRAEQTTRHRLLVAGSLPWSQVTVADREFAQHGADQPIEVAARCQVRQEDLVLLLDRLPVGALHVRIIEVSTVDAPVFVEDLPPLRPLSLARQGKSRCESGGEQRNADPARAHEWGRQGNANAARARILSEAWHSRLDSTAPSPNF